MSTLHKKLVDEIDDDDYLNMHAVSQLLGIDKLSLIALDLNHEDGDIFPESHSVKESDGCNEFGWRYSELKEYAIARIRERFAANKFDWGSVSLPRFVESYDFCSVAKNIGEQDFWISHEALYHGFKFDPRDQVKANEVAGRNFPKPHMVTIDEEEGPVERWLDSEVQAFCRNAKCPDLSQLSSRELYEMIMDELP